MEMSVEDLGGDIKYVTLTGDLDIEGAPSIEVKLAAISGHHKHVIADLAGVAYIASIGIGVLVKNAKAVQHHGGQFILCSPVPAVEEVLRTMVIDKVIPIFATKDAALAALTS